MASRTILITGASDGIGAVAAAAEARRGDRVLLAGRSEEKLRRVARNLPRAEIFAADFTRLDDVRALAAWTLDRVDTIDVLALNAGGIFGNREITVDGHEKTFQVNHLAHFLLTDLLLEPLRAGHAAVVSTSSVGARFFGHLDLDDLDNAKKYTPQKAYGDAKLANILFTKGIAAHYGTDGISAVALHPGNVATNFAADTTSFMRFIYRTPLKRLALISPEKGGESLLWAMDGRPGIDWVSGEYYENGRLATKVNPQQNDPALVQAFWDASRALIS